jgi:hypothetical protein
MAIRMKPYLSNSFSAKKHTKITHARFCSSKKRLSNSHGTDTCKICLSLHQSLQIYSIPPQSLFSACLLQLIGSGKAFTISIQKLGWGFTYFWALPSRLLFWAVVSGHAFAKVEKRIMIDSKYIKCCTLGFLIMWRKNVSRMCTHLVNKNSGSLNSNRKKTCIGH